MKKVFRKILSLSLVCLIMLVGISSAVSAQPLQPAEVGVTYQAHVQNIGWQAAVTSGIAGTEGRSLRLEALKISLTNAPAGAGIQYAVHVQNIGWMPAVSDGAIGGTTGRSLRAEAVKISLVNLPGYSVEYRVHVQNIGWMDWVKDGAQAGTTGRSLRMEAIEIRIVSDIWDALQAAKAAAAVLAPADYEDFSAVTAALALPESTTAEMAAKTAAINAAIAALEPFHIDYVSLGDSIATGTTTPVTPSTDPYTDQFEAYLKEANPDTPVVRSTFETDGDRTNELLAKLMTDTAVRDAVRSADIITVSIGGNNLMQACKIAENTYDFFNPDIAAAEQGYADFVLQWGAIMAEIRSLNADADVIAMTLYNPYNIQDAGMHAFVDGYLFRQDGSGMNDLISRLAPTYDYHVADAFTSFDAYSDGIMWTVTLLYPPSLVRNPHPNQIGQDLLFGLHQNIYDALYGAA